VFWELLGGLIFAPAWKLAIQWHHPSAKRQIMVRSSFGDMFGDRFDIWYPVLHRVMRVFKCLSLSFVALQCREGFTRSRCRPKRWRWLQQCLWHLAGERHSLAGRWGELRVFFFFFSFFFHSLICMCAVLFYDTREPADIIRHYDLHKNVHLCTCLIPCVLFSVWALWQLMYFLFAFLWSDTVMHTNTCIMAQARTHQPPPPLPPVCVGFLQTYLYGICILQTFIRLSGLGPRGAGVAWGSVSQTHTDGWARVVCVTLYWVS